MKIRQNNPKKTSCTFFQKAASFLISVSLLTGLTGCEKLQTLIAQQDNTAESTQSNELTRIKSTQEILKDVRKYYSDSDSEDGICKAIFLKDADTTNSLEVSDDNNDYITMPSIHFVYNLTLDNHDNSNYDTFALDEIKFLSEQGCDINEVYQGFRVLELALIDKNPDMFTVLINNGANPLLKTQSSNQNITGMNVFEIAERFQKNPNLAEDMKEMTEFVLTFKERF